MMMLVLHLIICSFDFIEWRINELILLYFLSFMPIFIFLFLLMFYIFKENYFGLKQYQQHLQKQLFSFTMILLYQPPLINLRLYLIPD
jgi:hypothetical protein